MTSPQTSAITTRLNKLPAEVRAEIKKAYERHKRACERLGVEVDPNWWYDALIEAEIMCFEDKKVVNAD